MHEHVNDPYVQEATAAGLPLARGVQADRARRADKLLRPGHDASSTWARRRAAGRRCCASRLGPDGRDRRDRSAADGRRLPGVDVRPGRFPRGRRRCGARSGARRAQGRPCGLGHGPQYHRASRRRTRRAPCIWASWRWNSRSHWLQPGGDLVVKAFQGAGFRGVPARACERAFREGLRAQAEGVAGPQPRDVSGGQRA